MQSFKDIVSKTESKSVIQKDSGKITQNKTK